MPLVTTYPGRRDVAGDRTGRGGTTAAVTIGSAALLLYTLGGYPVLAALLARLRPRPGAGGATRFPAVSLIVAALDESAGIDAKLANCRALDYPRDLLELVVVTDGSVDDTPERAARHEGVVVLHEPVRRGKAAALTRGARASRGDLLVFTDANNRLLPNALQELVAAFGDPQVGCVTGRKVVDDGSGRPLDAAEGLYWRYEAAIRRWESRWGSVSSVNGELLALRREAFSPLPDSTVNDDFVLAMEAAIRGWRITYAEKAVSLEQASATTTGEATRRSRIVAGRWHAGRGLLPRLAVTNPVLAWQVLSHKVLRVLLPVPTIGLLSGSAAAVGRRAWAAPLLGAQLVFYCAAAVGWRLDRRNVRNVQTYLPYYFVRMNVATVKGFAQALRRSPTSLARWQRVERT